MELAHTFARFLPPAWVGPAVASSELEAKLARMLREARATWPGLAVPDRTFLGYVASRLDGDGEPDAAAMLRQLDHLHTVDLYLACACYSGDEQAIAVLERSHIAPLETYLAGSHASSVFEELKQALRERVLVGRNGVAPKIASYNGRGPLGAWLRMVAARMAIDVRRKQRSELEHQARMLVPIPDLDPELRYLKERYRPEFERALESAIADLSPREGTVLRLHFLDGIPLSSIARMYHVSTRTVQRWVSSAQEKIVAFVRRRLTETLALSAHEVDSLLGLVTSQLHLSLHRLFKVPARGG